MDGITKAKSRIISIDGLRGLAMFLILAYYLGGAPVLQAFILIQMDYLIQP